MRQIAVSSPSGFNSDRARCICRISCAWLKGGFIMILSYWATCPYSIKSPHQTLTPGNATRRCPAFPPVAERAPLSLKRQSARWYIERFEYYLQQKDDYLVICVAPNGTILRIVWTNFSSIPINSPKSISIPSSPIKIFYQPPVN